MTNRLSIVLVALLLSAAMSCGARLPAQDPPTVAFDIQEQARGKFRELTERMQKLMVILQKSEPEDSKLLVAGLRFVQERRLHPRLEQAGSLLREQRWDEGLATMIELQKDLRQLLDLLQNRSADLRKLLDRIGQLEAFRDRARQLAVEQLAEKEASARTESLQSHLADIAARREQAERLLADQTALRAATGELPLGAAAGAVQPLTRREELLQQETSKLAGELADLERRDQQLHAAGEAGAADQATPGQCSGSAGEAAGAMQRAQQELGRRKPEQALPHQDQARRDLQRTIEALDRMADAASRELLKLPFEQQADRQEATRQATDTLARDMEQAEQNEDGSQGQQTPGKKRVQQAVPKQRAAAGQLKEFKSAKQRQQDAKDDLDAATKELEDALAQLRQQLRDEVLRALEERFAAMLARQRELSLETRTVDATRGRVLTQSGELPAALAAKIRELAAGETGLELEAGDALKLLEEDGTTAVFPPLVEQLRDDLRSVAARLNGLGTGAEVQTMQREVEDLLELLINALRRTIERNQGDGQGGNCNGQPPLVPISAELKMLRFLQERVNKATMELDGRPDARKAELTASGEYEQLSDRQGRVRDLMRRLAVKLGKENDVEEGR